MLNTTKEEILKSIAELAQSIPDPAKCALAQERLESILRSHEETLLTLRNVGAALAKQGQRIGKLEGFQDALKEKNLDTRVTAAEYAIKELTTSMQRFEASMTSFSESLVDNNKLINEQIKSINETLIAQQCQHTRNNFFNNLHEKILPVLIGAALMALFAKVFIEGGL